MRNKAGYALLFGLSADPVHQMHVELVANATGVLRALGYDITRTVILPVYRRNPAGTEQKHRLQAAYEARFAMCQILAGEIGQRLGEPGSSVEVSRIEQRLVQKTERPNYTVETLQALRVEELAGRELLFLLGSDLLSGDDPELGHWRQPDKLFHLATLVVYPRPGHPRNEAFVREIEGRGGRLLFLEEAPQDDIAARQIRRRLAAGEDPLVLNREGLLPEPVALYIRKHKLYRGYKPGA